MSFYLSDYSVTFEIGQSHSNWNETTKFNMEVVIWAELERLLVNTCHTYPRTKKANSSFCHIQPQMLTLYPVRIVGATDFTGATLYPLPWGNMINNVQMTHIQKMMQSQQSELLNVLQLQSLLHPLYVCVEKRLKHCF